MLKTSIPFPFPFMPVAAQVAAPVHAPVSVPPPFQLSKPVVSPPYQLVDEGQQAVFTCLTPGYVDCEVQWHYQRLGGPLPHGWQRHGNQVVMPSNEPSFVWKSLTEKKPSPIRKSQKHIGLGLGLCPNPFYCAPIKFAGWEEGDNNIKDRATTEITKIRLWLYLNGTIVFRSLCTTRSKSTPATTSARSRTSTAPPHLSRGD